MTNAGICCCSCSVSSARTAEWTALQTLWVRTVTAMATVLQGRDSLPPRGPIRPSWHGSRLASAGSSLTCHCCQADNHLHPVHTYANAARLAASSDLGGSFLGLPLSSGSRQPLRCASSSQLRLLACVSPTPQPMHCLLPCISHFAS